MLNREEVSMGLDRNENGSMVEIKDFLITRYITKINKNCFEVDDTSNGWVSAKVDKKTLISLLMGKKSWINLNWK